MQLFKGLKDEYFVFNNILNNMYSNIAHTKNLIKFQLFQNKSKSNNFIFNFLSLCEIDDKPCHCNYFYKLKATLMLKTNHFIPRCPYYTTYFAFRRTGIHPPYFIK